MAQKWPDEAAWLKEILSWPVEWSALHGIAELRTPISRTTAATDATGDKLVVRYNPDEGATGNTFPHIKQRSKVLTFSKPADPQDNGFATRDGMNAAHSRLLALAKGPYRTVIDLGCGDGLAGMAGVRSSTLWCRPST